jgi:hypothetical protein
MYHPKCGSTPPRKYRRRLQSYVSTGPQVMTNDNPAQFFHKAPLFMRS